MRPAGVAQWPPRSAGQKCAGRVTRLSVMRLLGLPLALPLLYSPCGIRNRGPLCPIRRHPLARAAILSTLAPGPPLPLTPLAPCPPAPCSYAAIFKHAKDELGFCYYLIPCGSKKGQMGSCKVRGGRRQFAAAAVGGTPHPAPRAQSRPARGPTTPPLRTRWPAALQAEDLKRLHENAIKHDPFISRAMGPNPKCERMRAGSLRVGGQGEWPPGPAAYDSTRDTSGQHATAPCRDTRMVQLRCCQGDHRAEQHPGAGAGLLPAWTATPSPLASLAHSAGCLHVRAGARLACACCAPAELGPRRLVELPAGLKTTYDDHLIIVGDAAGFIDPLTGKGGAAPAVAAIAAQSQPRLAGLLRVTRCCQARFEAAAARHSTAGIDLAPAVHVPSMQARASTPP